MKCKPICAPGGTLSKTRLASRSGGILAGSTGEYWRAAPVRYWPDTRQDPPARDTQRDTQRDPLASYSGILSGILGGIHWRAARRDTRRDLPASSSGGILGGIHWPTALAGYSAGSAGEQLWRDTRRDPLANSSGGILGGIHWRAALAGYSAGSTGEQLWRDTGRIHWRAALAGYWAGAWAWCRSIANASPHKQRVSTVKLSLWGPVHNYITVLFPTRQEGVVGFYAIRTPA